jgi:hypothetical protein
MQLFAFLRSIDVKKKTTNADAAFLSSTISLASYGILVWTSDDLIFSTKKKRKKNRQAAIN